MTLGVGEGSAGVAWGEADGGLDPGLGAEGWDGGVGVDYSGGEGSDEAHRVPDGYYQFTWAEESGIGSGGGGEFDGLDAD